jgi:serine/threonine protein phosphatase PrpC
VPLSWLPLGQVRASASSRAAALESSKIEDLESPKGAVTCIAGGKQTKGALPLKTASFDAALYSSRGRGYARYNEDAAQMYYDAAGRLYASVFDQAGGLGGRVRGQASEICAHRVFDAFKRIATSTDPRLDIPGEIIQGFMEAHERLVARGEGEVSTAVALVAAPGAAIMVNSGDSGAIHFDANGNIKSITRMHEADSPLAMGALTHSVGLAPEGPAPDVYGVEVLPKEWIILCTDGLLDAGLKPEELAVILTEAESAEVAVNKLATRILRLMTTLRAKPDNLTIIALRALS